MTQAYPLQWPEGWARTPASKREATNRFKTTFNRAREQLYRELGLLRVQHVVVSSWLPLRLDGQPRADAARMRIEDPGIAVYFQLRNRPMVMARDAFTTVHDNLRSIGLAIEHLRGLERHGGASMMERAFEGFAALPPPTSATSEKCWGILGIHPGASEEDIREAFRQRAKIFHPDIPGGSDVKMHALVAARERALQLIKRAA